MTTAPAPLAANRDALARRLLKTAQKHAFDPGVDMDWEAEVDPDVFWLPPHRVTLYGTDLWDEMSHLQRVELSKHEVASMYAMELRVETALIQMLVRYAYTLSGSSPQGWHLRTEIAEECRHSIMFGRVIEKSGCPDYPPAWGSRQLIHAFKTVNTPVMTMAGALFFEEYGDTVQRECAKDETIQPLVRQASHIHVVEEARHIQYARDELARRVPELGVAERLALRFVLALFAPVVVDNMVRPGVYRNVGLDPKRALAEAKANPHHHDTVLWASARSTQLFDEHHLIGPATRAVWRRSHIL